MKEAGLLSIVATPIGNLGDITLRALETLKKADVIACEDTRVSSKLLARYEIKKPLLIYNAPQARTSGRRIAELLEEGKHIALVTDAGTPGISDPGSELVAYIRKTAPDIRIEAIPGASALTAALSVAGVTGSEFRFLGFLPHKKGRETMFKTIAKEEGIVVFYESPHRMLKAFASLAKTLQEDRIVIVCRELSKLHEEVAQGTAKALLEQFSARSEKTRAGEFVVIVSAC
jgi:16S rRNA (cytidine1402-2'-O)-methyltransferase